MAIGALPVTSTHLASMRTVSDRTDCFFYHVCNLPNGEQVGGHWDLRDTIDSYLGGFDFSGKTVFDVGTASGYLTFEMERRGATVTSFEQGDPRDSEIVPFVKDPKTREMIHREHEHGLERLKNSYWYLHGLFQSRATAYYGDIYNLPETLGLFDVVMVGMCLPHIRDPLRALESIARRAKDAVIITQQAIPEDRPIMQMIADATSINIENMRFAWWIMSDGCVTNFMRIMGFRLESMARAEHLCTAYSPSRYETCTNYIFRRGAV
jgi:SAM-dependent methyltransferase